MISENINDEKCNNKKCQQKEESEIVCVCVFDEAAIEEVQSKKRGVYYFQRNSKEKRN